MKRFVVGVGLAVLGAGIGWAWGVSEYRSVAMVEVVQRSAIADRGGCVLYKEWPRDSGEGAMFDAFLDTQASLLGSPRVVAQALADKSWSDVGEGAPGMDASEFTQRLSVGRVHRASGMITVQFDHPDPKVARAAADLVASYGAWMLSARDDDRVGVRLTALEAEGTRLGAQRDEVSQRLAEMTEVAETEGLEAAHLECWKALIATRTRIVDLDAEIAAAASAEGEERALLTGRRTALVALEQEQSNELERLDKAKAVGAELAATTAKIEMVDSRREQLSTEQVPSRIERVQVVAAPTVAASPVAPSRPKRAGLGALIGTLVALGVSRAMRRESS